MNHGEGAASNGHTRVSPYGRFVAAFDRGYERFSGAYKRLLGNAVDRPGIVVAVAGTVLLITLIVLKLGFMQTEIFPASNSKFIRFGLRMPTGTAVSVMNKVAKDVETRMAADPRVEAVGDQIGSGGGPGSTSDTTNLANMSIELKSDSTADAFVSQWNAALTGSRMGIRGHGGGALSKTQIAALHKRFGDPIPGLRTYGRTVDIVQEILARGQDALQIQIYGDDINKLYNLAEYSVVPKLQEIPGLQPPRTGITNAQPELDISVNRAQAAQLGLDTATIAQVIDTATSGTIASYMQLNGTQYPITVQLPPDERRSLQAIENLDVPSH